MNLKYISSEFLTGCIQSKAQITEGISYQYVICGIFHKQTEIHIHIP